jgi:glycosyltransferase involved in cell wall biosynthesis
MNHPVRKYRHSPEREYTFSILIPSWNNLPYLRLCLESITQHSRYKHQVIVFVNEGSDGTLDWLKQSGMEDVDFIHSPDNVGICYAVNESRTLARADYLVFINDDMYVLPGWDEELLKRIDALESNLFMLSSTMIEPGDTGNNCVVVKDYGTDLESFRKDDLLRDLKTLVKPDWSGSTWPPSLVHVDTWDLVGGYSEEFSPGMYSDPDFSYKIFEAGARHFIGVGSSLVYHFGSKSTGRIKKNNGRKIFLSKWGITANTFRFKFLKMGKPCHGALPEPSLSVFQRVLNRVKAWINGFSS